MQFRHWVAGADRSCCFGSILPLQPIQQLPQINAELAASTRSKLAKRRFQIPLRHSKVGTLPHLGRSGGNFRFHAKSPCGPSLGLQPHAIIDKCLGGLFTGFCRRVQASNSAVIASMCGRIERVASWRLSHERFHVQIGENKTDTNDCDHNNIKKEIAPE